MDKQTLLETAPLVQGRLRDQRNEICKGYVEWAVFTQDLPEEFEAGDIIEVLASETDISFDDIQVNSALEKLEDEDLIEHKRGQIYSKSGSKEFDTIDSLLDDCWDDFTGIIDKHPRDIDVHYIDSNMEPAFRDFFDAYVGELVEEAEILEETQQDVMYTADILHIIENAAEENRVDNQDVFKECLIDLLKDPSDALKEYVGLIYVAIVNSDLMKRQKSINLPDVPEEEKRMFFDSNVIQNLICETDNEHPLIKNVAERSRELGFELYYFPETVDDLQRSVDGAIREMQGLQDSNYSAQTFNNQFIKDWHREFRRDGTEWGDYRADLQRWELEVEARYKITEYEPDIGCPDEEVDYAREIIDRIDSERSKRPKKPVILNHDAKILAKTAHLRKSISGKHKIGPLLLSLDNSVTQASDYAFQEGDWDEGLAVPPRVWFNYLLTFSSAEFESIDVGEIILNVSANISSKPTVQEYAKAVEEKTGLEAGSAELLAKYLRFSTYSDEIERSLRKNDGNVDEWVFKALDNEETMEKFTEQKDDKETIRKMGNRIQNLEEENQELRESDGDTHIHNTAEAHGGEANAQAVSASEATAKAEASAELQQDIDDFIDFYFEQVPPKIQQEIPPPPEDKSNLQQVREWLNVVTTAVNLAEPSTAALTAVGKFGERLLNEVSNRL